MVKLANERQPAKACSPMLFTVSGIVTLVSDRQPAKACGSMRVTESGIVKRVSELQPSKACSLIRCTPFEMVTLPIELQFLKANIGMSHVSSGMLTANNSSTSPLKQLKSSFVLHSIKRTLDFLSSGTGC